MKRARLETRRRGRLLGLLATALGLLAVVPGPAGSQGALPQPADQVQRIRDDFLERTRDQAQRLADFYNRGLSEQVGRQIRDLLRVLVEAEGKKAQVRLDLADRGLVEVGRSAQQLTRDLAAVEKRLLEQHHAGNAARRRGDSKAAAQLERLVQAQRTEVLSLSKRGQAAYAALLKACDSLAATWPRVGAEVKDGAGQQAAAAAKQLLGAVNAVGKGKAGEAAAALTAGCEQLQRVADAAGRTHAAAEVYRAAEAVDRVARATAGAADSFRQLARTVAGLQADDAQALADAVQNIQQAVQRSRDAVTEASRLGAALTKLAAAAKDTPQALIDVGPHAGKALAELQQGNDQLARGDLERAGVAVTKAAAHLQDAARELHQTRRRLGLDGEQDTAALLAREVEALLASKLTKQVEEQFAKGYRAVALPTLVRNARTAADKALPANQPALKDTRDAVFAEVERLLGDDLLTRVKAADQFLAGAGGQPLRAGEQPAPAPPLLPAAEKATRATIDRLVATLVSAGVSRVKLAPSLRKDLGPVAAVVPPPQKKATGVRFVADGAITIDGDLSDWKDLPALQLDGLFWGTRNPVVRPAAQKGYVAYNARGLFVAVAVADTTGALENHHPVQDFWLNDCLEIYVDTARTGAAARGEPNTHQFFAFPFGHRDDPQRGGYEARITVEKGQLQSRIVPHAADVIRRAAKKTPTGWTMEVFIPKEVLRGGDLAPGRVLGFNLQIDTGSDLYFFWNSAGTARTSLRPDTWGEARLLAADEKVKR